MIIPVRPIQATLMGMKVLAVLACAVLLLQPCNAEAQSSGPRFRPDGMDAAAMGSREGYPSCNRSNFPEQRCRVGALSDFASLFPSRSIPAPAVASRLLRAPQEPALRYTWNGRSLDVDSYLDRHPVTGFLIARGEEILLERYQYARTDRQQLTSYSMAKTITALLVGLAVKDGLIRSTDDPAERYAEELKGTEYGRTPIKALLQMSSGVSFKEELGVASSDITVFNRALLLQEPGGSPAALRRFNTRLAPSGTRWYYASAETSVLGLVVAGATRRSLSDYAREKLWEPLGAEHPASWIVDATGREVNYAYFNAALRDWARLGLMMAHDGTWGGKQVVPRDWMLAATTIAPSDPHLRLSGGKWAGYGYQTWLIPGKNRAFALWGFRGQFVLVDAVTNVVVIQTAAGGGNNEGAERELLALFQSVSAQLASRGR